MGLKRAYPTLTEKEFWECWDTIDTNNAMKFARFEKGDIDYIFEKKLNLGDKV